MLAVEDLHLSFSGIRALQGVTFSVDEGTVTALIGPNGAGKTTVFNCISGIYRPTLGSIRFEGSDVLALRPQALIRLGIVRTFQHVALFSSMSVLENVQFGLESRRRGRLDRTGKQSVDDVLDILALTDHADRLPETLPLGVQKRVELARAIAAQPRLLLLDEPASGLAHDEVVEMKNLLLEVKSRLHLTILVVEHNMSMVMSMSDRVVVLSAGTCISDGTPSEVQQDPMVIAAYLGEAS